MSERDMPESLNQRTLRGPISCAGVGLHSGVAVSMCFLPARPDTGIVLARMDVPGRPTIRAHARNVVETSALATTLGSNGVRIQTVEHVLAAFAGMGIDNARIELTGPEVPIMDGSAAVFIEMIRDAGVRVQETPKSFIIIKRHVRVDDGDKHAAFSPARGLRIDCTIDFEHPLIHDQAVSLSFADHTFVREVARARTFGFLRDVEKLQAAGLAKGGSLDNAIVVDDFSILNPEGLRFPDEFVRHKVLDALGDISLLGLPLIGQLSSYKSGHALNHALVSKLLAEPACFSVLRARATELPAGLDLAELEDALTPSAA